MKEGLGSGLGAIVVVAFMLSACVEKGDTNVSPSSGGAAGTAGAAGTGGAGGAAGGCAGTVPFGGRLCFSEPQKIPVATPPSALAVADLDNDGRLDLVLGDLAGKRVGIMRNLGGRELAPVVPIPLDDMVRTVAVGPLTSAATPDIIVGMQSSIALLPSGGGAQFGSPSTFAAAGGMGGPRPAVGDMDADGLSDIVTSAGVMRNLGSGKFELLPQQEAGTQFCPGGCSWGISSTGVPQLGDFDSDGRTDVVMAMTSGALLFLNQGSLSYASGTPVGSLTEPWEVLAADFDSDGLPDVATCSPQPRTVEVSLNNGSGGFKPPQSVGAVTMPTALGAGDVDGDGDIDMVVGSEMLPQVVVLLNDGLGGFAPTLPMSIKDPESPVLSIKVADLDGDSLADIVIAAPYFGVVILYGEKG